MDAKGLSQRELAGVLGVSLDRVKSLTSGRAKKLAPEEFRALVEKLDVRAHYLATGEPPIFLDAAELALQARMASLRSTTDAAVSLDLPAREGELVRDVLYGVAIKNAALVRETIETYVSERRKPPRKRTTRIKP